MLGAPKVLEMTRYGMKESDFAELASLIAAIVRSGESKPHGAWREEVLELRNRFSEMRYCL